MRNYKAILIAITSVFILVLPSHAFAGTNSATAKGPLGQVMTVTPVKAIKDQQVLVATGAKFSTKMGIYVAFCVIPAKGKKPENCFGGINIDGSSKGSIWISSTAPFYAKFLTRPYGKKGTFKVQVTASRFIGDIDCKLVRCGVVTRADHYQSDYRKADVLIPVSFQ